jgi:hypothetical protein
MAKRFDPKAKARKQKIIAAGLGVVFLGIMIFQAPTILGMFKGSSSTPTTTPAPAPTPTAPPATPGAAPTAAPAPNSTSQLVDSDLGPEPAEGQLVSFDRFESKDPFLQQVGGAGVAETPGAAATPTAAEPGRKDGSAGDKGQAGEGPTLVETPQPDATQTRTAKISVNGVSEDVEVSGTFPESQPIFKLVSIKGGTVRVGIVDGAYATGAPTITLKRGGKPVTLMNTADGTTYVLRLVSVG